MNQIDDEIIIQKTKNWITDVVIACNFCPFAAREIHRGSVHFEVQKNATIQTALNTLNTLLLQLNSTKEIETTLLIFSNSFLDFNEYLNLVDYSERFLKKNNYEGIYQVASFHPDYLFAGSNSNDPSNYTNRSPYPMLHILREESLTKAIDSYPDIENVPERNIAFTKEKGLFYMQELLKNI